ncbi:hypothetical protein [uncultured Bradyrhizobium sp.]|uniref:hypothetical protein n=1 Tax=uncultured Bradyrhizobium sp. TaxID=199684 RepID=UPI00261764B4|nr:hypothetical protein [uncultured Bradyrhizobium sp.]
MGEGAKFIRREGVKQECIALQMEGNDEARLLLYAQGLIHQAMADILEDPVQRQRLIDIATFKPKLQLVHSAAPGSDSDT